MVLWKDNFGQNTLAHGGDEMTDRTICYCIGVTEGRIVQAIKAGANSLKAIQGATHACTGNRCKELNPSGRCCSADILALIERETGTQSGTECCCHE